MLQSKFRENRDSGGLFGDVVPNSYWKPWFPVFNGQAAGVSTNRWTTDVFAEHVVGKRKFYVFNLCS